MTAEGSTTSGHASRKVTVVNKLGLHARPAMSLVDHANKFDSDVKIAKGSLSVDGKSIMHVMMLAATKGTELEIKAAGRDAEQAVTTLAGLVESGFDEE